MKVNIREVIIGSSFYFIEDVYKQYITKARLLYLSDGRFIISALRDECYEDYGQSLKGFVVKEALRLYGREWSKIVEENLVWLQYSAQDLFYNNVADTIIDVNNEQ